MRILFALSCALLLAGVVAADQLVWGTSPHTTAFQDGILIDDVTNCATALGGGTQWCACLATDTWTPIR